MFKTVLTALMMFSPIIASCVLLDYGEEWFNVGPWANFGIASLPMILFCVLLRPRG